MVPVDDWMLIEETAEVNQLVVPDLAKDKDSITRGFKVLAVGPGWWDYGKLIKSPVKTGDIVLLDAPMVARFQYNHKKYTAAKARNVAFIMEEKDKKDERRIN